MTEERRAISEVRDIPTEIWIKVLSFLAVITLGLMGYIGDRFIVGQDKTNEELKTMNGYLQTHESRISRNERDIKDWSTITTDNLERIHKLEGIK